MQISARRDRKGWQGGLLCHPYFYAGGQKINSASTDSSHWLPLWPASKAATPSLKSYRQFGRSLSQLKCFQVTPNVYEDEKTRTTPFEDAWEELLATYGGGLGLYHGIQAVGGLGLVPGMPNLVFITIASALGYAAWWMKERERKLKEREPVRPAEAAQANPEATWDDLQPVDTLGLEVGYRLIALVDKTRQGDLLARIKGVRKKFAQDVGFLPPPVHIRDNLELKPAAYRITLRGVVVGEGEAYPGSFLAINPGGITTPLIGTPTQDPAFGLPAHWIEAQHREAAQMAGYTVVDCETVMATHLSHLMQVHAAKLLSRTETQQLVDHVTKLAPRLIEEVVPKMVPIAVFQKVLQLLLEESVHIRDVRTIIETLAEHAAAIADPGELARRVRVALAPAIVQQIYGPVHELNVIAIDLPLERLLVQALGNANGPALDPSVADLLTRSAAEVALKQEEIGVPACLLVPDVIRSAIARLVRRVAPRLQVLAHSEVPESHSIRIGPILKGALT